MPKPIKQQITFDATPKVVYAALMDSSSHSAFTGAPAKISNAVGAAFSAHGGYIRGINVELVPGKRIVQAWRGKNWPKGAYSIATFELEARAKGKARLIFTQYGVPDKFHARIAAGWKVNYWQPLKLWLARRVLERKPRAVKREHPAESAAPLTPAP
jgi:activator of HSP90 ATPase